MAMSPKFNEALGKIFRNLEEHSWYIGEAVKQGVSVYVIHPFGHKAVAYCKAHLLGPDKDSDGRTIKRKVAAEAYVTDDSHEYLSIDRKHYRYDAASDSWVNATPK